MLKFATAEILSAHTNADIALVRTAHRADFSHHQVRPGYLYVRSRAISSRCNDNFDEFPAEELEKSYKTFIGKPVFVNHVNHDTKRARGVVIDAALHRDRNPDGTPDTWVEVLMEVDGIRFPKLAEAILAKRVYETSMGCDVDYSICSACGNKATRPEEYCRHIPAAKGTAYSTTDHKTGARHTSPIREICYGLRFFENSLLVEAPADPTAQLLGVDASGLGKAAAKTARYTDTGPICSRCRHQAGTGPGCPQCDTTRMLQDSVGDLDLGDEGHDMTWQYRDAGPTLHGTCRNCGRTTELGAPGMRGDNTGQPAAHKAPCPAMPDRQPDMTGQFARTTDYLPDHPGLPPHLNGRTAASTDGYINCDQGHCHWGTDSAAGMLIHNDGHVLLGRRADWVQHGGTWGIPGGALHEGEAPEQGAHREATEELGDLPGLRHTHTHHDDHGGWGYHTVIAEADHRFHPDGGDGETDEFRWVHPRDFPDYDLHPGFAASWPHLAPHVRGGTVGRTAAADDTDYRFLHTAPDREGVPLHRLLHPSSSQTLRSLENGRPADEETGNAIEAANGNPRARIKIYRAVPAGVTTFNPGDWVGLSSRFARDFAEGRPNHHVITTTADARHIHTDGNDALEWGYNGPAKNGKIHWRRPVRPVTPDYAGGAVQLSADDHDFVHGTAPLPERAHRLMQAIPRFSKDTGPYSTGAIHQNKGSYTKSRSEAHYDAQDNADHLPDAHRPPTLFMLHAPESSRAISGVSFTEHTAPETPLSAYTTHTWNPAEVDENTGTRHTATKQPWWVAYSHGVPKTAAALEEPDRHYLRFGDWPDDERSINNVFGHKEDGVSVYDLHRGRPVVPGDEIGYGEHGNDTHEELQGRIDDWRRGRHPAYVVRGNQVGFGHDGEPLLRDVEHVHDWAPERHHRDPAWPEQIAKEDPAGLGYGKLATLTTEAASNSCPHCGESSHGGYCTMGRVRTTDWSKVPHFDEIHRGFPVHLGAEDHAAVHDPDRSPAERGAHLLGVLRDHSDSLGSHWSTDQHFAHDIAQEGWGADMSSGYEDDEQPDDTHVVIHARFPEHHHIETDPEALRDGQVFGWNHRTPGDYPAEHEVPLKYGAPVHVTGISYKHADDDRWTHAHFGDDMTHTAALQLQAMPPKFKNPAQHPFFKDHPVSARHVLAHWADATPEEKAQGERWYSDAHLLAKALAHTYADGDTGKAAGVISAYSPRTSWAANMHNAARSLATGQALGVGEGLSIMGVHHKLADKIMNGEDYDTVLKGPKTNAFAKLIHHGGVDPNTGKPMPHVVIDRHALSVATGHRLSEEDAEGFPSSIPHYYDHVAKTYARAARTISKAEGRTIAPHQVQAATWLVRIRHNRAEDLAARGGGGKGRAKSQDNRLKQWQQFHPTILPGGAGDDNMHMSSRHGYDSPTGWRYDTSIRGRIKTTSPEGTEQEHWTNLIGNGLTQHRHPQDMPVPLYHGTSRQIPEGTQIEPGHPGNFVRRMKHVYMAETPEEAAKYAGPNGHVYEVRPTGWYGHRSDAKGQNWASEYPLDIVRVHSGPGRTSARRRVVSVTGDDYKMMHKAPDEEGGSPLHELTQNGTFPDDVYHHPDWYTGMVNDELHHTLQRAQGHPDAEVNMYRAVPKGVTTINKGDWVTPTAEYAHQHAYGLEGEGRHGHVLHTTVPARHLIIDNDLQEAAYHGPTLHNVDRHHEEDGWAPVHSDPGNEETKDWAGYGIHLSPEDHAFVHDPHRPTAERAHRLLNASFPEGERHHGGSAVWRGEDEPDDAQEDAAEEAHGLPQHPHPATRVILHGRSHTPGVFGISWAPHAVDEETGEPEIAFFPHSKRYPELAPYTHHTFDHRITAVRKTAYGETKAPAQVDTLRDDACDVCGNKEGWDGQSCPVCLYMQVPENFRDPDTGVARTMDLRGVGDAAAQTALDQGADAIPGGLDQSGDTMPGADPAQGQLPGGVAEGPGGEMEDPQDATADGEVRTLGDGDGTGDPAAQEAEGQTDVQVANGEGEMSPSQLPPGAQDVLSCPNCGYQTPAGPPVSSITDDPSAPASAGPVAGDVCPNCGQAVLLSSAEEAGLTPAPEVAALDPEAVDAQAAPPAPGEEPEQAPGDGAPEEDVPEEEGDEAPQAQGDDAKKPKSPAVKRVS